MEFCLDFVEWLGPDAASSVLVLLEDPADLVRVSAVSHSWRRFVIENGFCKSFCSRICSEASNFTRVIEISSMQPSEVGSSSCAEWRSLEREHRVYSYLSHFVVSPAAKRDCILDSVCASSTDNLPDESIENTLEPIDHVGMRPSYWSSKGEKNTEVPETLTYSLFSKLCVINEIKIQPFKAYFQNGNPIYSAKSVRFRMGYCTSPSETSKDGHGSAAGNYRWLYVSPEFQMLQENALQSFKLPRPVLCIGGILQIELLGRVQAQETDGLYYICVCHVKVLGYPLMPRLDANVAAAGDEITLKYLPEAGFCTSPEAPNSSSWHALMERIEHLRARARDGWHHPFLGTLLSAMESDLEDEEESPLGYW